MLVLTRKVGEEIVIGDVVKIRVLKSSSGRVQLAFDAPKEVSIQRKEVWKRMDRHRGNGQR